MNQLIAIVGAAVVLGCILWFLQGIKSTDVQIRKERQARGKKDVGF